MQPEDAGDEGHHHGELDEEEDDAGDGCRTTKATITPMTPTTTMAAVWRTVSGCLSSRRLTSLLTEPMLRSRHGR